MILEKKFKNKVFCFVLISIFAIQSSFMISELGNASSNSMNEIAKNKERSPFDLNYSYNENGMNYNVKQSAGEFLKIIIATPQLIDENSNISVYVSGLRSAKANYVEPKKLTIRLRAEEAAFTSRFTDPTVFEKNGYLQEIKFNEDDIYTPIETGDWIPDPINPVTKVSPDIPIYNTTFPALGMTTKITIEVEFQWRTPWYEVLTQIESKEIQVAPWRDFEKYLDTGSEETSKALKANAFKGVVINELVNTMRESAEAVTAVYSSFKDLEKFGSLDPAIFRFYLLNISTIVDPNLPTSFINQYNNVSSSLYNPTMYQSLLNVLSEINIAYQESKSYLESAGIEYVETVVNYSYNNFWNPNAMDNGGKLDANWNNENLNTTSLEFLMEGFYWSTNPYTQPFPYEIMISNNEHSGNYPSSFNLETGNSGNGYILNEAPSNMPLNERYSKYTWLYTDHYEVYKVHKVSGDYESITDQVSLTGIQNSIFDKENNKTLYGGNNITGIPSGIDSNTYNISILFEAPGFRFKPFKSIIVNLMYDMFPILNQYYSFPTSILENYGELTYDNLNYVQLVSLMNFTDYNKLTEKPEYIFIDAPLNNPQYGNRHDGDPSVWKNSFQVTIPDVGIKTIYLDDTNPSYYTSENLNYLNSEDFFKWLLTEYNESGSQVKIWYQKRNTENRNNRHYLFGSNNMWNQSSLNLGFHNLTIYNDNGLITDEKILEDLPSSSSSGGVIYDPNGNYYFNIFTYFLSLSSFGDSQSFFINFIGEPFGRLIYDNNTNDNIGMYNSAFNSKKLHIKVNNSFYEDNGYSLKDIFGSDFRFSNFALATIYLQLSQFENFKITRPKLLPSSSTGAGYSLTNTVGEFTNVLFSTNFESTIPRPYNFANGTSSPGIYPYSFDYIDSGVQSEYALYGDYKTRIDTTSLSDYLISPYKGSLSDTVPVGLMYNGYTSLIQNSHINLTEGMVHSYSMIMYTYKQAYLSTLTLINMLQKEYTSSNRYDILTEISKAYDKLQEGWGFTFIEESNDYAWSIYNMNLTKLNEAILEILQLWIDPNSITAENVTYSYEKSEEPEMIEFNINPPSSQIITKINGLNVINVKQTQDTSPINQADLNIELYNLQEKSYAYLLTIAMSEMVIEETEISVDISGKVSKFFLENHKAWEMVQEIYKNTTEIEEEGLPLNTEGGSIIETSEVEKSVISNMVTRIKEILLNTVRPIIISLSTLAIDLIQNVTQPFIEFFNVSLPNKTINMQENIRTEIQGMLSVWRNVSSGIDKAGTVFLGLGITGLAMGGIFGVISVSYYTIGAIQFLSGNWIGGAASSGAGLKYLGMATQWGKVGAAFTGVGIALKAISDVMDKPADYIEGAIMNVVEKFTDKVNTLSRAIANQILQFQKFLIKQITSMTQFLFSAMDSIINFIETVAIIWDVMSDLLKNINIILNQNWDNLKNTLENIGNVIMASIGDSVEFIIDLASDVFPQLKELEDKLKENENYLTIMDFFYPPFRRARLSAGYIDYTANWGVMSADAYYKWIDVYQPISAIYGADSDFQIYQLGDEFCEKLYFLTYYNGSIVNPVPMDDYVGEPFGLTIKKWVEDYKEFGLRYTSGLEEGNLIEGSGIIEGRIVVETVEGIDGLFYIEMNTDSDMEWIIYDEVNNEEIIASSNVPPFEGLYMTMIDAHTEGTYLFKNVTIGTNPEDPEGPQIPITTYEDIETTLNTTWSELTYLFSAEYIEDSFIQYQILPDSEYINEYGILEIQVGIDEVPILFNMINEMYSQPTLYVSIRITSENGVPIYTGHYDRFKLETPGVVETKIFNLKIGNGNPGGLHRITYHITEANGDTYQFSADVQLIQDNIFYSFVFAIINQWWVGVGLLVSLVAIIMTFIYIRQKRSLKFNTTMMSDTNTTIMKDVIKHCGYDKIKDGTCDHYQFDRKDWKCDDKKDFCTLN